MQKKKKKKWIRFPTPHFSLDLLCDLTSSLKYACMFFPSKIHNIGYILLKQTPLKTPDS